MIQQYIRELESLLYRLSQSESGFYWDKYNQLMSLNLEQSVQSQKLRILIKEIKEFVNTKNSIDNKNETC